MLDIFKNSRSRYVYRLPVTLANYERFPNSPEHKGDFLYAEDIAVPNPETQKLTVFAPQSGVIWAGVLSNTVWGNNPQYKKYLNWINVYVGNGEFFEIAHVAPIPQKDLFVGKRISMGQPILETALNGYITATNGVPDSHVHILVGKWLNKERTKFTSLKIRWKS